MKKILLVLTLGLLFAQCKKDNASFSATSHEKAHYRVLAVGKDTTTSSAMYARTQTVGLVIAEDSKLKAELLTYFNGIYTVRVTNKLSCDISIDWGWEGLNIDSITPNNNTVGANQNVTFTLGGNAKVGKIKLKSSGDCGVSSTLIINITADILPITFLSSSAKYDSKTNTTFILFQIDDPTEIYTFVIQKLVGTKWELVYQFTCDKKTTSYNIPIWVGESK